MDKEVAGPLLCYAQQDVLAARVVVAQLGALGYAVAYLPPDDGEQAFAQVRQAVERATAVIVLLTPAFISSSWCQRAARMAVDREEVLRAGNQTASLIHVLEVGDTTDPDANYLRIYDRVRVNDPVSLDAAAVALGRRLAASDRAQRMNFRLVWRDLGVVWRDLDPPEFKNRTDEIDKVINGLTDSGGPHFWLVVAPPQLGKTWFLQKIRTRLGQEQPLAWSFGAVDVRAQLDVRGSTVALLARMFSLTGPALTESQAISDSALAILRSERSWLCVLDSAELLEPAVATGLRKSLSRVHELLVASGADARLCLLVASRGEAEWRGVIPPPRLSILPLTGFTVEIVTQALREEMGRRSFDSRTLGGYARLVHQLSEGLPALLTRCLHWIKDEEWLEMERLGSQDLFEELAQPYIKSGLLSRQSLFTTNAAIWPTADGRGHPRLALEHAFRVLAPYRIFTQSHLRRSLETDPAFADALEQVGWSVENLWQVISDTSLLRRPLDEPWQELQAAIRRLLYRYYYTSEERQAAAHREARTFVQIWADRQNGKEQVIGLVEAIWHEAAMLRLSQPSELEESLIESATKLSRALESSSAYTESELRRYAVHRMRDDDELQEAVSGVAGLYDRLLEIVESAPGNLS